jgi:hypothetical protein
METYRSLVSISVECFKSLLLINGGAVIAILAFLEQVSNGQELAKSAWLPLGAFVAGTGLSVLAFIGSYATQFALYAETAHLDKRSRHGKFLWLTVSFVLLSLIAFRSFSLCWKSLVIISFFSFP